MRKTSQIYDNNENSLVALIFIDVWRPVNITTMEFKLRSLHNLNVLENIHPYYLIIIHNRDISRYNITFKVHATSSSHMVISGSNYLSLPCKTAVQHLTFPQFHALSKKKNMFLLKLK